LIFDLLFLALGVKRDLGVRQGSYVFLIFISDIYFFFIAKGDFYSFSMILKFMFVGVLILLDILTFYLSLA
jgi:hypothetical protein